MPFAGVSAVDEKTRFIAGYLAQRYSHTDLCRIYGISRRTGYKWIGLYEMAQESNQRLGPLRGPIHRT